MLEGGETLSVAYNEPVEEEEESAGGPTLTLHPDTSSSPLPTIQLSRFVTVSFVIVFVSPSLALLTKLARPRLMSFWIEPKLPPDLDDIDADGEDCFKTVLSESFSDDSPSVLRAATLSRILRTFEAFSILPM